MIKKLGNLDEEFVTKERLMTEENYLYLLQLEQLLAGKIQTQLTRYADLADIQAKIKRPEPDKIYGIVTGQGETIWNGANWVLAADDTTLIT